MSNIDVNDLNQDGHVTADEIEAITSRSKPPSFLESLRNTAAPLLFAQVTAPFSLFNQAAGFMDRRQFEQKANNLQAQYPGAQPTSVAQAIQTASDNADTAAAKIAALRQEQETDGSGYLGVDDLIAAKAVTAEVGEDGVTRYYVQARDGAREVLYKDSDAYTMLQQMSPKERAAWRQTMWLGGYLDPASFVGALTMEDIGAMQQAMTEANMNGQTWQDAIASRVELGGRYGRPITESEIAQLDDDIPALVKDYAARNGIKVSNDFIARQQRRVLNAKDTPESVLERLKNHYVKPLYPQFERELDNGMTIEDIAAPYVTTAAQMLELPEGQIDMYDPIVKRALQARDQNGQPIRKALWEFEDELTKDPRWKYTDNAYRTYETAVNSMISEMGL